MNLPVSGPTEASPSRDLTSPVSVPTVALSVDVTDDKPAISPPTETVSRPTANCISLASFRLAALSWLQFGLNVIPVVGKSSVVKWDPWLDNLAPKKITRHWLQHPDHEVGFIVGDVLIVFDADRAESLAALVTIEKNFDIKPNLVVKTKRGEHHYFRRAPGTHAIGDSHSTEDHPERLDVKTGRALVVLPPSAGKMVLVKADEVVARNAAEVTEIGQQFIDAVARHNGRPMPRPPVPIECSASQRPSNDVRVLKAILRHLDPDMGYDDWSRVGMAICYETGKSEEGFALFDAWSRTGKKYGGIRKTQGVWRSFKLDLKSPVTIGTLYWKAKESGVSKQAICAEADAFQELGGQNDAA